MNYLLLVLQQLIASSTHLVAKNITSELHPTTVVLGRGVFACAAFGIWWFIRRKTLPKIQRSDIGLIVFMGFLNLSINQLLFVWGIRYTTAPNAALAYALTPAFTVLFLALVMKQRPGWKRIVGIAVAFVGAAIVLLDRGADASANNTVGNIMVLLASASWAVFTVLGRRLVATYGAVYSTALTFFTGYLLYNALFFIIPVPFDSHPLFASDTSIHLWLQLVYLGVVTSAVGYVLWYYALTHMDASRVSVFNNLQPIFTTILAFLIFGTQPTMFFAIGGIIVLTGLIITQLAHDARRVVL